MDAYKHCPELEDDRSCCMIPVKNGIWNDNDRIFRYMGRFEEKSAQMSFF